MNQCENMFFEFFSSLACSIVSGRQCGTGSQVLAVATFPTISGFPGREEFGRQVRWLQEGNFLKEKWSSDVQPQGKRYWGEGC